MSLFTEDKDGARPCNGGIDLYKDKEDWKDLILYYEYFNAETGEGLGASHQTGWTSLVTYLIQKRDKKRKCSSTNE